MPITVRPDGPVPARIMIVGEAPGADEEIQGIPFVGASGQELNRMLSEAGILRSECFVTNVVRQRPQNNDINQFLLCDKNGKPLQSEKPKSLTSEYSRMRKLWVKKPFVDGMQQLQAEIAAVKPNIIVPVGNYAMWALTGKLGIMKWRGSMLYADREVVKEPLWGIPKVIPTIHPAAILREWSMRATVVSDLRRAKRFIDGSPYPKPEWKFIIRPSFRDVEAVLNGLLLRLQNGEHLRLSVDIETRSGHIACIGISWSLLEAICIPLMCAERKEGYWTLEEETWICWMLWKILTHESVSVVGQNIIYDCQYFWRWLGFVPRVAQDAMISQHSLFSAAPKALAYQASMYCNYYVFWKDEGKDWTKNQNEDELWYYNCEDCVYTDEAAQTELKIIDTFHQLSSNPDPKKSARGWPQVKEIHAAQQRLFWPVLKAMQDGVRIDLQRRGELILEVQEELGEREALLAEMIGHPLNPNSPPQMHKFFYEDLQVPKIMTRATKGKPSRPTLDDDALKKIGDREPLLRPILHCIADIRTLRIFLSGFLLKPLDTDQRMRCAFNIGGSESGKSAPVTYRLSSSENAFGSGGNLQNIPSEKSKSVGKAAARAKNNIAILGDPYQLPNIRSMFIPDPGYTFWDGDLDRADLQVVVWEADDAMLKEALRRGVDIHLLNAFIITGKEPPEMSELVEGHPKYPDHRGPMKLIREFAKVFCHATNYVGSSRTVASHTGRTIHEIDRAQRIWFGAHPGIKKWHDRVEDQITRFHFIENRFGYRWYIFDRIAQILPEAVAWIPQSTVSIVINRIWQNLYDRVPEAQVLLQIHDALAGQFLTRQKDAVRGKIMENARIVIPYEDPLIIPFSVKTSEKSWGDCH